MSWLVLIGRGHIGCTWNGLRLTGFLISPLRIAESLGAQFLAHDIQDRRDNVTRFIALGRTESPPTGDDKTSMCFGFVEDRAGILIDTLQELASTGMNMTKLESRPSKATLGEYIFLVDFNGHRDDPRIAETLERIRAKTGLFKVFGSYPCWREQAKIKGEGRRTKEN